MADQYRHAGIGWANGPVDNTKILALPSDDILLLSSEHWHHDEAVRAGKRVLFRGMARQGFRPAEVGWNARRYVDEITRDAVRVSEPITDFVAWNELNLRDERGDNAPDHGDLTSLYSLLGQFMLGVISDLRQRPSTRAARLHFGAWAPKDETDYTDHWRAAAERCDVMDVHAYGPGPGIVGHIEKYRALFPGLPIELTEWHSDLAGSEEDRRTLELLAEHAAAHQDFRAYYFAWRWDGAPSHQRDLAEAIAIEDNFARLRLFENPPLAAAPVDPPPPDPPEEPIPVPTVDPWQYVTAEQLAGATECPLKNVQANWPRIVAQLELCKINDRAVQIAMAGTIAKESASTFAPVREAFWLDGPARWAEYTRRNYGGGPNYHGRGFIQVTHRSNYQALGPKIAVLWGAPIDDTPFHLVANPDNLLDADMSAAAAAIFFRDTRALPTASWPAGYSLVDAAHASDWEWVRRLVYGGRDPDGEARIARIALSFTGGAVPTPTTRVTFNAAEPAHPQDKSFDCSQESLEWALWALGRKPADSWLEATMIAEGVMSAELGLLDATGAGLAAFVRRQYGEFLFSANHEPSVSWEALAAETNPNPPYPILLGGRGWNHWSGVRGFDPVSGLFLLANPSSGWKGVHQTMNRQQWDALGPFSIVRVLHPDLLSPAPPPPPPPDPIPPRITLEELLAGLRAITALSDDRLSGRAIRAEIDELIRRA